MSYTILDHAAAVTALPQVRKNKLHCVNVNGAPYTYWPCRAFNRKSFKPSEVHFVYRAAALLQLRNEDLLSYHKATQGDAEAGQWLRDMMHLQYGMPL